eukprot:gnl/MRDRNA2_/MRDRNA2_49985_c0_seq2.p1 gnl/MRDRNA2_/MRDRNA2_49985_c0~~gnl/MRDRNA2_/MRDRNA2_49985_c0_seq2.p1  ORF type:complete len:185 (-),score=30.16 gnl/MRDRNA2_/MRDRNA2_49985_c0_seq2:294-848(-)
MNMITSCFDFYGVDFEFPLPKQVSPWMRASFLGAVESGWPIFSLLSTLCRSMIAANKDFDLIIVTAELPEGQLPSIARLPCWPSFDGLEVSEWPLEPWAPQDRITLSLETCGMLQLSLVYLNRALEGQGEQGSWEHWVRSAEHLMKSYVQRHSAYDLLYTLGRLPDEANPWELLHKLQQLVAQS